MNGGERPSAHDDILSDETETYFDKAPADTEKRSPLVAAAQPNKRNPSFQPAGGGSGFLVFMSDRALAFFSEVYMIRRIDDKFERSPFPATARPPARLGCRRFVKDGRIMVRSFGSSTRDRTMKYG